MIEFENVDKYYGAFHALKDISISVREGERMVICGPSGSGKSTLIRCINGLEFHNSGTLTVDGIEVHAHSKQMPVLRQQVGMVFQQFNLFPHLTVLENLMIGPMKVRKLDTMRPSKLPANILIACISPSRRINIPARCRVANNSVWRLPDPCVWKAVFCCSTSRRRRLIPR